MDVQGMEESDQLLSESDNEENSAKTGKQTPLDRAHPKGVIIYCQFAVWKLMYKIITFHPRKESGVVGAKVMDRGGVSEANQTSSSSGACLEITFTCQVYTCMYKFNTFFCVSAGAHFNAVPVSVLCL